MKRKRIQKNKNIVKRGYINYETNKENRSISDTVFMCIHASGSSDLGKKQKKYDLKVSDVKVSSKNLKPGDKCKISMKIVNRGYGKMKNVYVCYDSPSTQVYYVPLQYKKSNGRWVGNFKVEKGMQKGTWRIWSIDVNRVFDDIYASWYAYYNHKLGNRSYPGSDLSKGNIKIRKTKADHKNRKFTLTRCR